MCTLTNEGLQRYGYGRSSLGSRGKGGSSMPVNVLSKDVPKGEKPPEWVATLQSAREPSSEDRQHEIDLAVQEQEALWESEEVGIVKWSGENGQRYSD